MNIFSRFQLLSTILVVYGLCLVASSCGPKPDEAKTPAMSSGIQSTSVDGSTITADPNPIPGGAKVTTISWKSKVSSVQVRVGSPSGPLFTRGGNTGHDITGAWVMNNTVFYLQDATAGKDPTDKSATLATVTVTLAP